MTTVQGPGPEMSRGVAERRQRHGGHSRRKVQDVNDAGLLRAYEPLLRGDPSGYMGQNGVAGSDRSVPMVMPEVRGRSSHQAGKA